MKEALLTIIIPIYNKEMLLRQCLDSFANKKFEGRLEVLAIDDGSGDSSLSIASEYGSRYPEIYQVIEKENGGVGSVMNLGLQYATGKYIKEVDADDYVDTEALERLLDFLEECNSDIVITPFKMVNEAGIHIKMHPMLGVEYGREYLIDMLLGRVEISIQSLTIRRMLLLDRQIQLEETRYYVDMQLISESIYYAETGTVYDCILYYYRINQTEQSVSLESYIKNRENFRRQTELSLERFCRAQRNNLSEAKKRTMKGGACGYSAMLYTIYLMNKSDKSNEECKAFDAALKEKYPVVYDELGNRKLIQDLREKEFENMADCQAKVVRVVEELKMISGGNISLGDICALELGEGSSISRFKQKKQSDKFREHFQILNHWFMNYQKGNTVGQYLLRRGYNKIAIYGFGALGERLYQELLDSEVSVVYGIDRKVVSEDTDFTIVPSPDTSKEVDAIIITAITDFIDIATDLREKVKCPIISLEEAIYES